MRVLVAIASYGDRNRHYLEQVLDSCRAMTHDVDIVVMSNTPKDAGPDVEVRVGLPSSHPRSLPFAHRTLFRERLEQYDLFIYTEDDILVEQRHIDVFLAATAVLHDDEIAGFLRYEVNEAGGKSIDSIANFFRWAPESVVERGGMTFALFTNEHAACFMVTREQLRRAIASGGFGVEPSEGRYAMLETAATDIYTKCGMRKLIGISRVEDYLVHHLPNKYLGVMGVSTDVMNRQIEALHEHAGEPNGYMPPHLFRFETLAPQSHWSKGWYEKPEENRLLDAVPATVESVLSVGCGWGASEEALAARGYKVSAIPVDAVFARLVQDRGIEVLPGALDNPEAASRRGAFDCVLLCNLLHLSTDPVEMLRYCGAWLKPGGVLLLSTPNLALMRIPWLRIHDWPDIDLKDDYEATRIQLVSVSRLKKWLHEAGFAMTGLEGAMTPKRELISKALLGLWKRWFAHALVVTAIRTPADTPAATP